MGIDELLAKLVEDYRTQPECKRCHDREWYRQSGNISEAIRRAAHACVPRWEHAPGKKHDPTCRRTNREGRHPHQRHLTDKSIQNFHGQLSKIIGVQPDPVDFGALHLIVNNPRAVGIGELAVYDASLRIGFFLGVLPQLVYLHKGTMKGAKRLFKRLGNEKLATACKHPTIDPQALPEPVRKLEVWEIEDFLCIYKNRFG